MVNKYAGTCEFYRGRVPKNGGDLYYEDGRWKVAHLSCQRKGTSQVTAITFSSGETFYRNKNGRCEDAPCCGCCTI